MIDRINHTRTRQAISARGQKSVHVTIPCVLNYISGHYLITEKYLSSFLLKLIAKRGYW
tara:strand:- start:336 stop:512 length:177 start_codon:yes stop_codon:yes gene_type:complete